MSKCNSKETSRAGQVKQGKKKEYSPRVDSNHDHLRAAADGMLTNYTTWGSFSYGFRTCAFYDGI